MQILLSDDAQLDAQDLNLTPAVVREMLSKGALFTGRVKGKRFEDKVILFTKEGDLTIIQEIMKLEDAVKCSTCMDTKSIQVFDDCSCEGEGCERCQFQKGFSRWVRCPQCRTGKSKSEYRFRSVT